MTLAELLVLMDSTMPTANLTWYHKRFHPSDLSAFVAHSAILQHDVSVVGSRVEFSDARGRRNSIRVESEAHRVSLWGSIVDHLVRQPSPRHAEGDW